MDFPLVSPDDVLHAQVVFWVPVASEPTSCTDEQSDIAVLELKNECPAGVMPERLVTAKELWNHRFRVFGFPQGHDNGVFASGILKDRVANGWVMIEAAKQTGFSVQPGFSGTPVWDEKLNGVIGIIVESAREIETKVAFMIPGSILIEAWDALKENSIPPSPYKGLYAFQEEDARFFFGRETFVERLMKAIHKKPLVAVVGVSGSGKSSVAFAGVIPRLRREGTWIITSFRPKDSPFYMLSSSLIPLLEPNLSQTRQIEETRNLAKKLSLEKVTLRNVVEKILQQKPTNFRMLIVIDQFEELYALCHEEERKQFLDVLLEGTDTQPHNQEKVLTLLITLRVDFIGQAISYRPFADSLQYADLKVGPMSYEEMQRVIEEPARKLGVELDEGLTARILEIVEEAPGNLPLLEFTLTLLWEKQNRNRLTHTAFEEIGGVNKSLASYAEKVYGEFEKDIQDQIRKIMIQLVRPGEGTEDTRRLATISEVGKENWDLITHLASKRLVVTGRDNIREVETVEIVHEALIKEWKELREWIEHDRSFRTWQERIRTLINQWISKKRDESGLLRGVFLSEAEGWYEHRSNDLNSAEQQFIQQSIALRNRMEVSVERRKRYIILGLVVGILISLSLSGLAGFYWWKVKEKAYLANQARKEAVNQGRLAHRATS